LVSNHEFHLATRAYAQQHDELLAALLDELAQTDAWGERHPKETAAVLAAQRYAYGVQPITAEVIAEQQRIAEVFADLKLIPKRLRLVG
jgi:sulfonate transport system substrate-binding protein